MHARRSPGVSSQDAPLSLRPASRSRLSRNLEHGAPAGACRPTPMYHCTYVQELHADQTFYFAMRIVGAPHRQLFADQSNPYACLSSSIDSASAKIPSFCRSRVVPIVTSFCPHDRSAASGSIILSTTHRRPYRRKVGLACEEKKLHSDISSTLLDRSCAS